ncbi:MAG: SDR family oxidoreductase [Flavobacteriales bacterium]|nr:SDR family oxidoreductase [Flavobacteriales bacterium]
MQEGGKKRAVRPRQRQRAPGSEKRMRPLPIAVRAEPDRRLKGKVALITGGDSGIGRAVAVAYAQEGCDVAIAYWKEHTDARATQRLVEEQGRECLLLPGDLAERGACVRAVRKTVACFGQLDILVNNAGMHTPQKELGGISERQLTRTFAVNVFACFHLAQEALKVMERGACIIQTTSVTAYRGSAQLIDYAATKGALVSFTRSLSAALVDRGIRVNAVAPGPVWTPLIVSSFPPKKVAEFGSDAPMQRAAQPSEIAPSYVFLASADSSFITGQVLHPNGGEIVNG